jgi:hypothetical protein
VYQIQAIIHALDEATANDLITDLIKDPGLLDAVREFFGALKSTQDNTLFRDTLLEIRLGKTRLLPQQAPAQQQP